MITNDLQNRIHLGDREAFLAVYQEYGRGVYTVARKALSSDSLAKSAVKQTFLTLYEELLTKTDDFDIPVRIRQLADREIYLLRLISGKTTPQDDVALQPEEPEAEQFSARDFAEDADLVLNLPSLEREHAFRKPRNGLFLRKPQQKADARTPLFWKILLVLIDLFLLWVLAGLLMGVGYLPVVDLGYVWFSRVFSSIPLHLA
ncbi:MAG: hypothetical protein PHW41_03355 [Eubacteriales bacterium]|nr:hypothetical protein [Eubacteriales bacterium]